MDKIKNTAIKIKKHWDRHWVTYAVGAVAVGAIVLNQANLRAFYKFLEEKGIDPMEYYAPEIFEELHRIKEL